MIGIEYLSAEYPFDDHGKSILMEAKHGYVAVHAERKPGGAWCRMRGKDAGVIHTLSVAVSMRATVHQEPGGLVSSYAFGDLDLSD